MANSGRAVKSYRETLSRCLSLSQTIKSQGSNVSFALYLDK